VLRTIPFELPETRRHGLLERLDAGRRGGHHQEPGGLHTDGSVHVQAVPGLELKVTRRDGLLDQLGKYRRQAIIKAASADHEQQRIGADFGQGRRGSYEVSEVHNAC
jgi:hypothetical protein